MLVIVEKPKINLSQKSVHLNQIPLVEVCCELVIVEGPAEDGLLCVDLAVLDSDVLDEPIVDVLEDPVCV